MQLLSLILCYSGMLVFLCFLSFVMSFECLVTVLSLIFSCLMLLTSLLSTGNDNLIMMTIFYHYHIFLSSFMCVALWRGSLTHPLICPLTNTNRTREGLSPLDLCISEEFGAVVALLCTHNADLNLQRGSDPPLWQALNSKQEDVASILVQWVRLVYCPAFGAQRNLRAFLRYI